VTALQRLREGAKTALGWAFGAIALITLFLTWGYFHQLFSFADCEGGKPDMSIGSIVASGFGFTICAEVHSTR
jgi:hypothetical protein